MTNHLVHGRSFAYRTDALKGRCPSCDIRLVLGEPSDKYLWSGLNLTQEQVNKLLLAAAEFDQVAEEHDDRPTAVEFVDWGASDFLEGVKQPVKDYDGIQRTQGAVQDGWPPNVIRPSTVRRR